MLQTTSIKFLQQLGKNNNKVWFDAHRDEYAAAKEDFEQLVTGVLQGLGASEPLFKDLQAKDCVFRIFRDVRFGADKSPYKTNFGAFIAHGGRKSSFPGYYFHFEPGESMLAGGVYQPQPDTLKLIRDEVYFHSAELMSILEKPSFKDKFGQLGDFDKMKKGPKDFPADFPDIDLLKYRSYIVSQAIPDDLVVSGNYQEQVLEIVHELQPFMAFLNRAINNG